MAPGWAEQMGLIVMETNEVLLTQDLPFTHKAPKGRTLDLFYFLHLIENKFNRISTWQGIYMGSHLIGLILIYLKVVNCDHVQDQFDFIINSKKCLRDLSDVSEHD